MPQPKTPPAPATPAADPSYPALDIRLKIAGLWVSVLLVFAYVDIFSLFRADVLEGIARYQMAGLEITQTFLALTTIYIVIPSVMVALTLFLPRRANKRANAGLALLYILTIAASCIGETWIYYLLGSAVEIVLLMVLVRMAYKL